MNLIFQLSVILIVIFRIYNRICNDIEYRQIDSGGPDADCSVRVGSVDEVTQFLKKRTKKKH